MGEVWRARDPKLEREVAIKVLPARLVGDEQALARFESEVAYAVTEPGAVLGTVGCMSPEQVRGQPADARSDLFALGAVLYELATGRRAFATETAAETGTEGDVWLAELE